MGLSIVLSSRCFLLMCCVWIASFAQATSPPSLGNESAIILQYHHVDSNTPRDTSVDPSVFVQHLDWLDENDFKILPIHKVLAMMSDKTPLSHDKNVVITFDDANQSVCETAWPLLKARKIPFVVFINTLPLEEGYKSQCDWQTLKEMVQSGLMTPGNHSHAHGHMISKAFASKQNWRDTVMLDISKASSVIYQRLGIKPRLFAYPYGEFNARFESLISELGFIGFGQQSGAIGYFSDFSALPRFPASGNHSNLETLSVKLMSLPLNATIATSAENPIEVDHMSNPPTLELTFIDAALSKTTQCFNASGARLPIKVMGGKLRVFSETKLSVGRHRYTCTSPSPLPQRYYWFSHQWLIDP